MAEPSTKFQPQPLPPALDYFLSFLEISGVLLIVWIIGSRVYRWIHGVITREIAKGEAMAREPLYSQFSNRSLYGDLADMPDPTGEFEFTWQKFEAMDRRRLVEYRLHLQHLKKTSIFDAVISLVAGLIVAIGLYGNGLVSPHFVAISLLILLMLISPSSSKPSYRISTGTG
ncbi:hypothetical protein K4F52_005370 [Lecanicillium sp. MT-2017a]|nr:hypothetical protein K4F52_005370 [Lecanicillium sp. MT-2017a]